MSGRLLLPSILLGLCQNAHAAMSFDEILFDTQLQEQTLSEEERALIAAQQQQAEQQARQEEDKRLATRPRSCYVSACVSAAYHYRLAPVRKQHHVPNQKPQQSSPNSYTPIEPWPQLDLGLCDNNRCPNAQAV